MKTTEIQKDELSYQLVQIPTQVTTKIKTPDNRELDIMEALTELLNDNLAIQGYLSKLIKG
jgi:hypothetical protein